MYAVRWRNDGVVCDHWIGAVKALDAWNREFNRNDTFCVPYWDAPLRGIEFICKVSWWLCQPLKIPLVVFRDIVCVLYVIRFFYCALNICCAPL